MVRRYRQFEGTAMTNVLKPDICIIGAGSGGLSVAAVAASFGAPVVLIEKGAMGGDCLNHGCVPSKALLAAGKRAQAMREAEKFGIAAAEPRIDFKLVNRHVHDVIASIAPNVSVARFTALGVHVINAEARFKDARTVVAGDVVVRARRFVLATGSAPLVPPIPGLDEVDYLTSDTLFDLTRRPGHLVVIGGGQVGMEMAQAHRRLGSRVTVLEAQRVLGGDDPEMSAIVLKTLRAEGVVVREEARIARVERRGKTGIRIHLEGKGGVDVVDGTHLLVAAGRTANVADLDLDKAGIAHGPGGVTATPKLCTTNRRVYAVGDVAGPLRFTHVAAYHAGLVVRPLLFRLPAREDRAIIPRVTFTDPELAQVGMTEADARATQKKITVLRWPLSDNDRARAERQTAGHIKIVAGRRGRILGVSIVGAGAGDMIHFWALAVSKKYRIRDVVGYVPPYPTVAEIGKRASLTYLVGATRRPVVRRLIRFLRIFG
jgi:pyruvate/2-oxoglutarate dehydrogenase complex dihydrolipoamide dehydrogenase (E3) component